MHLLENFIDFLKHERRYSAHTCTAYHNDLLQFSAFCETEYVLTPLIEVEALQRVDTALVRDWMQALKVEKRSIRRKLSALNTFCKYACRQGWLVQNPAAGIALPKLSKPLPVTVRQDELAKLLDETQWPNGLAGMRDRLILELLYGCGLRRAELAALRATDFDLHARTLRVMGKGRKERIIPFSKTVLEITITYLTNARQAGWAVDNHLLYTDKGRPAGEQYVYSKVRRYLQLLNSLPKTSPHVLRHTFATHLVDNGADLNAVKEMLGHSSLVATQVYVHNSIKKLKAAHAKAHPRAQKPA